MGVEMLEQLFIQARECMDNLPSHTGLHKNNCHTHTHLAQADGWSTNELWANVLDQSGTTMYAQTMPVFLPYSIFCMQSSLEGEECSVTT